MVKHVVMFRLKEELELEMKQQVIETFRKGILALPATIPFIRAIEVGVNINANETWDICLNSSFDTFEEACAYGGSSCTCRCSFGIKALCYAT